MKLNSKKIGRLLIFKYLGITVLILILLLALFNSLSTEMNESINRNLIHPFSSEPKYFTVQIVLNLIIIFFISGNIGKSIIEKNKDPFWTTFFGYLKMSIGIFFIAMLSEMTLRAFEFGIDFKLFGLGFLIWVFTGAPIFLIIGGVYGGITSWFIGKEILNKKTHYNNVYN
ncbi:hypothetical protein [Olleya aquimaris]|uniref:Uncharacterized protein n=1 Tax=Olleya aquimaris TaxID=639310 RepID=A0A327RC57_9FLAO|nr:hypothetical protein [Olleya aquimaris]RAJ14576.1 hypothetical protein LY08_01754 [Olleya aquimaris]